MRLRRMLFAVLAAAVVGVAGAGAATTPATKDSAATVRTAKLAAHSGLLTQRGRLNYAGPHCPGRAWNCTTSTRVLQIATDNGRNLGECGPTGGTFSNNDQTCVIMQAGSSNTARCVERSSDPAAAQSCDITQTGDSNRAFVDQDVSQDGSATETATQSATVKQTGTTLNDLHLRQNADQKTAAAGAQAQDVQQAATVVQTATGSGGNAAQVDQSQAQKAKDGLTQAQNTNPSAAFGDCNTSDFFVPMPNACANIVQTADAGDNATHLRQSIDEDENSGIATTQQQQLPSGGIDGHVHLVSATGKSSNDANQSKKQNESGPATAIQTQYDPMGCCGLSALGNDRSTETLDQSSTQHASSAGATQLLSIFGQTHSPTGSCSITQHASDNADSSTNNASQSPCVTLVLTTSCASAFEIEGPPPGCVSFTPEPCPPDVLECVPGPVLFATTRLK